jgi:acetyl-CoA acyltransferase
MIADQWEIPRSELDELAVRSHRLAHQATEEGRFERATIPFQGNGDTYVSDQGIRPDTALEKLSALKPAFKPDRKVTAGNASQISDGATALLMSADRAAELGLTPRARIVDQTTVGVDPVIMLTERGRSGGGSTERHDAAGSGERAGREVFLEKGLR